MSSIQKLRTNLVIKVLCQSIIGTAFVLWFILTPSERAKPSTSANVGDTCYQDHWNSYTQKMSPTVYLYLQKYPGMTPGQIAGLLCK